MKKWDLQDWLVFCGVIITMFVGSCELAAQDDWENSNKWVERHTPNNNDKYAVDWAVVEVVASETNIVSRAAQYLDLLRTYIDAEKLGIKDDIDVVKISIITILKEETLSQKTLKLLFDDNFIRYFMFTYEDDLTQFNAIHGLVCEKLLTDRNSPLYVNLATIGGIKASMVVKGLLSRRFIDFWRSNRGW